MALIAVGRRGTGPVGSTDTAYARGDGGGVPGRGVVVPATGSTVATATGPF